ncbi:MAG TPA: nuclear transport factor 2 family protein [Candidatus Eremiobacteraceae bacterium]|nr:nuclear transport factor 2 family protein [Candidatus Eremiobacteraceae bacterium]
MYCKPDFKPDSKPDSMIRIFRRNAAILVAFTFLLGATSAQTPHAKSSAEASVQQELVRTENGFFEAWKTKDQAYFREHMLENGIFWGDAGTFSRDQQLAEQQASAKVCTVEGYGLSDFGAIPLAAGAYLLTYKAEEYATCNGEKAPVHMNGSSIYVFKAGRWQAIYRAEVALKNP